MLGDAPRMRRDMLGVVLGARRDKPGERAQQQQQQQQQVPLPPPPPPVPPRDKHP
jgi:hypothetical protein